jgi:hypothetical protein
VAVQVDYIRDNFLVKCLQGQDFRAGINHATRDILLEEPSPFFLEVRLRRMRPHYPRPVAIARIPLITTMSIAHSRRSSSMT